ncbi:MAG: glycosyltransferase, partial [Mesorhizobium sp.]
MIAVVITTYNHTRFLEEAIQSCLRQSRPMDEIIVVDDGSTDNPASVVERHPGVRLIRQDNCGLAAARNTGLAASRSDYITFLDADDRLLPNAIETGVRMLVAHPDAVLAYGAHRFINGSGAIESDKHHVALVEDPYLQLLRTGNFIAMHATVVYRRERLAAMGGFDASMRSCEDYELFLRIARRGSIVTHDDLVAEYRIHGDNMSNNRSMMLAAALSVLDKQLAGPVDDDVRLAVRDGRRFWKTYYTGELTTDALRAIRAEPAKAIRMLRQA